MSRRTILHQSHAELGARMVDFGGWDMPVHYGSQIDEHHAVRADSGMFDVSHMTVVDLQGSGCRPFLRRLLANDVAKLKRPGKALYSCMLNHGGGVLDDLIVYFFDDADFRLVVNAGTREKDLDWITEQAGPFDVRVLERPELAMIAVQGPKARSRVAEALSQDTVLGLRPFNAMLADECFVARTGYTGEDGFEIILSSKRALELWSDLLALHVRPCGLGARDTLRLEAGMNLYGSDMDESVTPFECGLAWTVALNDQRDFIGAEALRTQQREGVPWRQTGLLLEDRGVLRAGQPVPTPEGEGVVTSGTFSPTLKRSIGLARVPADATAAAVEVRGKRLTVREVKPPFVRNGEIRIEH